MILSNFNEFIFILQYLLEFANYLTKSKNNAQNNYYFLSNNTYDGLVITWKATVEIISFLCTKCSYEYLMTSRLS